MRLKFPCRPQAGAARDPASLLALCPADFLLPALATGLQVPRALLCDHMWLTGARQAWRRRPTSQPSEPKQRLPVTFASLLAAGSLRLAHLVACGGVPCMPAATACVNRAP